MPRMENVVIAGYLRSPFSRSRPGQPERDVYNNLGMVNVAAKLIKEIVERTGIDPAEVNDVYTGCTIQAGEQMMLSRMPIMLADMPINVPGASIERVCCSGMSALHAGAMEIELGLSEITIACGVEHMTHLPMDFSVYRNDPHMIGIMRLFSPKEMGPLMKKYDLATAQSMGLTAEKLFTTANEEGMNVTREDLDKFAVRSHNLAEQALDDGYFKGEVLPVEAKQADGTMKLIEEDQSIRRGATLESTASLKPAFKRKGVITAGNASPLNAGAVSMLLMSKDKAKEYGIKPLANIISMGWAGVDPSIMGAGPVPATEMALKHAGMKAEEIDFWEINEAFVIVPLYAMKKFGIPEEKVNVRGGATAIGHPLATSGIRLTGTLARILEERDAKIGCATLCGGMGQGATTIIERA
ncbi:MAG: acetyl-CoA C-acetyltransferase [Halobacteriota archaeon]|nr:acetyl-CoA C-acetyltransferase [Halobacteriota archaeon]